MLLGLTALALGLRLWHLGASAIWVDEGVYLHHLRDGLGRIVPHVRKDGYPPLWFFYAWPFFVWAKSEAVLRLSSVLPLLGSLWMLPLLARRLGLGQAGLWAAALLALSAFSLEYSQGLKYITLFDLTCLVWFWAFLGWAFEEKPQKTGAVFGLWVALGALALWQHYLAFFALASQGVWVLGWRRGHWWRFGLGAALSLMVFSPWVLTFGKQTGHLLNFVGWGPLSAHLKTFPFLSFADVFRAFAGGNYLMLLPQNVPLLLLCCTTQLAALVAAWPVLKRQRAALLIFLAVPMLCVWGMMMAWGWFFHPRYFSQVFPLYGLWVGAGLAWAWAKPGVWGKALGVSVLSGALLSALNYHRLIPQTPNGRTAITMIQREFREGDEIVAQPPYMEPILWFYWKNHPPVENFHHPRDYRLGVTRPMTQKWLAQKRRRGVKRVWLYQGLGIRNRADQTGVTYAVLKQHTVLLKEQDFYAYPVKFVKEGHWALFDLQATPGSGN